MKKLLIATTNPGKLAEIRRFLSDLPLELVGLDDVGVKERVEETGKTFEENAILKAKFYAEKSELPTIADDGGFEIDALGGEPGVKSHRWMSGEENTDEELIEYTFRKMQGIRNRTAQLRAVLALALTNGQVHTATAATRGIIPESPSGERIPGFPYRSILFIPEIGKYYNQDLMTTEETEKYNHRKRCLDELKLILTKLVD